MSATVHAGNAAGLMDAIYRHQRHIYDASRKFYLLGRDELIAGLNPPSGGAILEIGCGTGRNLIAIARAYPGRACHGLDVSAEMLATARASVERAGMAGRIELAQADATHFDARALFGRTDFDRIVISYALSMIPPWEDVMRQALATLAPGGELHIVDFGEQARLPSAFKRLLGRWLALFHVTPRATLAATAVTLSEAAGATCELRSLYRGYAILAVLRKA